MIEPDHCKDYKAGKQDPEYPVVCKFRRCQWLQYYVGRGSVQERAGSGRSSGSLVVKLPKPGVKELADRMAWIYSQGI